MRHALLLWLRSLILLALGGFYLSGFWWLGKEPWFLFAIYGLAAVGYTIASVVPAIFQKEEYLPWVFKQRQTSKFSLPSQSLSSFLAANPLLSPSSSPSASPSLPSVTIDHPVVGFRNWKLNGTSLLPNGIGSSEPWTAAMTAQCLAEKKHPAPQPNCTCGLHAWLAPAAATWPSSGQVSGVVLASGKIYRHTAENGFRAERMRILALSRAALKEVVLEPCPKYGPISPTVYNYTFTGSANIPASTAPLLFENGAYRYGHSWATEDRELNLPTGTHRFKAKVKCEWCGCGPERECIVRDHANEIAGLDLLASQFGVPVIPHERVAQYAAEFGIIATEVKALGA